MGLRRDTPSGNTSPVSVVNMVMLGSAVVPPIVAGAICWILWRSGKRHDAWEAAEKEQNPSP